MALSTITNKLSTLSNVFNRVDRVLFNDSPIDSKSALASLASVHSELPVLADSVTLNMGEPDVSKIKITTGQDWVSYAQTGDSEISMQVASISGVINSIFGDEVSTDVTLEFSSELGFGGEYEGNGYTAKPKKVTGALIFVSQDKNAVIVLPKAEIYANFVAADGDNPAYWNLTATALENTEGSSFYLLNKSV